MRLGLLLQGDPLAELAQIRQAERLGVNLHQMDAFRLRVQKVGGPSLSFAGTSQLFSFLNKIGIFPFWKDTLILDLLACEIATAARKGEKYKSLYWLWFLEKGILIFTVSGKRKIVVGMHRLREKTDPINPGCAWPELEWEGKAPNGKCLLNWYNNRSASDRVSFQKEGEICW